ncbi:MAG: DEAD/DEAH box helicase family protein [archaeon]
MSEDDTRAELIEPKLKESGWGVVENSRIRRNFPITMGRIQGSGKRAQPLFADFVLEFNGRKLAVIEAKKSSLNVGEGVAQAKEYAKKLQIEFTFATNGKEIYQIDMVTGKEKTVKSFPTPQDVWDKKFRTQNNWKDKFNAIPFGGNKKPWFYQEIAVNNVMDAIAEDKKRLLLTLATGTGKTTIAFQIVWKLFYSKWNLKKDGSRRPRVLFLTDRNNLANQAFNEFSPFPEDALKRIKPKEIKKTGKVPTNAGIFFTIFQTFMCGKNDSPYFGQYPKDFFDFIIIDECHRGGANDEGNWRAILEYFSPAYQLGLTATPKRKENADTYRYFGNPLYVYSLKEGINDGFLTPFKVRRFKTTLDEYMYVPDDDVIEGEVEAGKIYQETDFNRIIKIKEREAKRVRLFMNEINQNEKTIVFCATQDHALVVRDLINQCKKSKEPNYCVRVAANDGALGDQYLEDFRDNEKLIPTILTTSQKLSTGVDARNIRNIILMRPIKSIIEFKQIVGRGTRIFEGKHFFTIYDFVDAYKNFNDPEWDGEPLEPVLIEKKQKSLIVKEAEFEYPKDKEGKRKAIVIKLGDGKEREIQHMSSTYFLDVSGKPISARQFLEKMFGDLPKLFKNEQKLRDIWSSPITRKAFLIKLAELGYGIDALKDAQKLIGADKSDLFDVLEYVFAAKKPITREERVAISQKEILDDLDLNQKEFLDFVLSKYVESGVEELDLDKLSPLLKLKYQEVTDAIELLGGVKKIKETFINFQKVLYAK